MSKKKDMEYNKRERRSLLKLRGSLLLLVVVVATFFPTAGRGADIFDSLADMQGVESTFISGRFAHNYTKWNMSERALDLKMGFSSLYAYECSSTASVQKAKQLLEAYVKKHPELEVVFRSRQGNSDYMMLEQFGKDRKIYKWVIWDYMSPGRCEIVVINWKDGYLREADR